MTLMMMYLRLLSTVSFEFLSVSLSFDGFEVAFVLLDLPLDTDVSMVIVSITIGSIGTSSIFDEATVPVFTDAISSTISIPSVTLPDGRHIDRQGKSLFLNE